MSLALLFHYLMLNTFRMLIQPSSGACDLFVELISWVLLLWFDVRWCYGVAWLGWMWYPDAGFSLHPDTTSTPSRTTP